MKAIVLAGGKGSRLSSVFSELPKPLVPVQGEPFLYILIRFLHFHKISEVILSTHHLAEKFREVLPELQKLLPSVNLIIEPKPLGTGGAARFACQKIDPEEHLLVLNGDTFFDFDLTAFQKKLGNQTALVLKEVNDSSRYGTVSLQNGKVEKFLEKTSQARPGYIYAGYSILKVGDLLRLLPEGESSLERDFFPLMLQQGREMKGEVFQGKFIDIGIPEDYHFANTQFDFTKFQDRSSIIST